MNSKKTILIIIVIGTIIGLVIMISNYYNYNNHLNSLNYSNKSIQEMEKLNITKLVIKKNKYSKTLETALNNNKFMYAALDLYMSLDYIEDGDDIENINDLVSKGYSNEQIITIFNKLGPDEIEDLLDHNIIIDIEKYLNLSYFNPYNLDRYLDYRDDNPELNINDIVTSVNIGLDFPYYVHVKEIDDPHDITVLVNKYRRLPSEFVPKNLLPIDSDCSNNGALLVKEARDAFNKVCHHMKNKGFSIKGTSGYRSYNYQYNLYNNYVNNDGVEKADTYSARPGHSEHQLGLAIDVSAEDNSIVKFQNSNEFRWLKNNAHKYGFIIRYPENKDSITGYKSEPWHYRYVGIDIATYIYENAITYDEYYIRFLNN
ncbi:MAG: M15 family metallopeptidase [Bacilli bacterium]|nr:M15 family metallopeptidase [Bacilli bacterium]